MGIPYYIASLLRKHKQIQQTCGNAPLEVDVLGIDFNCFIHTYLTSSNPIGSIVIALENLLTQVVRANHVYVAFDGLVPLAKIVQQRYRRMRKQDTTEEFDKHQISPATPYMKELETTLKFLFPNITVSGTDERGEGEHKIFQWVRTFDPEERKKICIYGLDADLVLISIAQRSLGDIFLLREQEESFSTFSIPALLTVLPMEADLYVRMCILCFGNDFMPFLAMFSLREDGYPRAIYYADKDTAQDDELGILIKRSKDSNRHVIAPDGHCLETRFAVHLMDGVLDWEPVVYAFWKTFEWTYHYFTTSEVLDWEWYYPYPEAPLVSILEDYDRPDTFTWDHPEPTFTTEDQLQFILPTVNLTTTGLSSIRPDELYDEETETRHPWMRRFAWECDPYISVPWGPLTSVTEIHLGQVEA
jgi:5'-3' exonuclease